MIYDNETFFGEYAKMSRSTQGLAGAGEWHQLEGLMPDMAGKAVLDLGCGYGWHCGYALDHGAVRVLGIDASEKMLAAAEQRNPGPTYRLCGLEEYEYPAEQWDAVVSNLVLHYVADLADIFHKIHRTLKPGGVLVFNIEHPVFTAGVREDWIYDREGRPQCWPVDDYYIEGPRQTVFLGCQVEKQHHTLQTIVMGLLKAGFTLEALEEARPSAEMLPLMPEEQKRPMMLLIRGRK
ncbi:MAG: class I SAM-dependent methyltransferase [Eubacteriales bacterium]|nr:class I SAM-dependent methyltransferase [Eubacteriales bacterium]